MKKVYFSPKTMIFLFFSTLLLLAIDRGSKYLFYDQGLWANHGLLHPALNTGISFSVPAPGILIFLTVCLAIGYIGWLWYQKSIYSWLAALLFAGAIGNVADRMVYGGVRDFLVIDPGGRFPGFICNIADIYLSVGMLALFFFQIFPIAHAAENQGKATENEIQ